MKHRMRVAGCVAVFCSLLIIAFAGCETTTNDGANVSGGEATPASGSSNNKKKNDNQTATTTPVEKEAKAGVGKKGKAYGGGMITEPASQYWQIKEKLAFGTVKHAEDLYRATNGSLPKSHDDYMKLIIKANRIELPELDEGLEYHYDTEKKMLMVQSKQEE